MALQCGGAFHGVHGSINMEGYKDILSHCIMSRLEDQFGDDSCLYQHDSAPVIKQVMSVNILRTVRFQKWTGLPRVLT
jgi:hypothetical protein